MTTINYAALAERIKEVADAFAYSGVADALHSRIADLRTVASLLDGMAEEKPVAWMRPDNRVREESFTGKQFSRGEQRPPIGTWNPLYLHPAPQAQPERQPVSEPTEQVTCGCGDEYPATSFEAGYICAVGHCSKCDAKPSSEPFDSADDLIAHLRAQCGPTEAQIENKVLRGALEHAEAALADIGDADREPGDDLAWCERRAADALPLVRAALAAKDER